MCGRLVAVLTVLRAFPCRTRLADKDAASAVEEEVTHGCEPWKDEERVVYLLLLSPPSDLSEPVHARPLTGGLVPQSPARAGAAVAAGHRLPDGPPAEAAGFQQRLPALPGHHLW